MLPIPTSRVFRSRKGALRWSFWVIVAAVMSAGFGDPAEQDDTGHPLNQADLAVLAAAPD